MAEWKAWLESYAANRMAQDDQIIGWLNTLGFV